MKLHIIIAFCSLFILGCNEQSNKAKTSKHDSSEVLRVVGYKFSTPKKSQGFSMFNEDGSVNLKRLKEYTVKKSILSKDQMKVLSNAVYGDNPKLGAASCYDPHHIFIFYNHTDEILKAIEICFLCTNLRTSPDLSEQQWTKHDFRSLARLSEDLGLLDEGLADNFIGVWNMRESEIKEDFSESNKVDDGF